jgi:hypothetical protein
VGRPDQVPTFASFFPETAMEEFDLAQRRDDKYALRVIEEGIATSFAPYGMTRELTIFVSEPLVEIVDALSADLSAFRQREPKRRAVTDCGLRPDPATMALDDPAHRREADAGSGELLVGM